LKLLIKIFLNLLLIFLGVFLSYWSGKEWYGIGLEFLEIYKGFDGSVFCLMTLTGIGIVE
jgi:hypothetical protein